MAVSAGVIKAGSAYVNIGADVTKLKDGLAIAGKSMVAFAGIVAGAIGAATKMFTSMGDEIEKASRRTGLSTEAISRLGRAARRSGTEMVAIETAVRGMNRTIYNVKRGSLDAVDALDALGISASELEGLSVEDKFYLVVDALSKVDDMSKRSAIAMAIFGRAGTQILPLIEGGAKGLREYGREAEALGLVLDAETAAAAAHLADMLGDLGDSLKMNLFRIGSAIAPMIEGLAEEITKLSVEITDWLKRTRHWSRPMRS